MKIRFNSMLLLNLYLYLKKSIVSKANFHNTILYTYSKKKKKKALIFINVFTKKTL